MTDALVSGILAGYGIAIPVGAMSVLVVTLASRVSLQRGMAAALGVATADGLYALAAAVGGTALSRLITPAAGVFEAVAAGVLTVIAVAGLRTAVRSHRRDDEDGAVAPPPPGSPWRTYGALVALTLLNPLTVVYFGALVVGGQAGAASFSHGLLFVLGAFVASASWQTLLATGGALLGRTLTSPRGRLTTTVVGNTVILLLAARLAWSAG